MAKGLIAEIYKPGYGDCSNGGVSSMASEVTIVGDGIPEVFDETPDRPSVKIVRHFPTGSLYIKAEPVSPKKHGTPYMFGGTFIYSCDSRFRKISKYPIPLHDRTETCEQYDNFSR